MPLSGTGTDALENGNFILVGEGGTRIGVIEKVEKKRLAKGTAWIVARGHEAKALLGRRTTMPQGTAERIEQTGPAETVMKALVEGQCGWLAGEARRLPGLIIAEDASRGESYALSTRLSNLLSELCRCARAGGLGFLHTL